MSVGVVVAGCGAVTQTFYAPALQEVMSHRDVKILGHFDPVNACRSAFERYFPDSRPAETLEELLDRDAQLAIIASPPGFHCQQATDALTRGFHVLCEKPMAPTSAECLRMIAAENAASRRLFIGHYKRFFPNHIFVKRLIESQEWGALKSVRIDEGGKFTWPTATASFFRRKETPGGVLFDLGVHVLDLLNWWLGAAKRIEYRDDARDGLEANVLLKAEYEHTDVRVRLSRDWPTLNIYSFTFEKANVVLRVNEANIAEITFPSTGVTLRSTLCAPIVDRYPRKTGELSTNPQSFVKQVLSVVTAVEENQVPEVSGHDGLKAVQFVERCYSSRITDSLECDTASRMVE